jgi:hypothetical protein
MIANSKCFAQIFSGRRGCVVIPFIDPDVENFSENIESLIAVLKTQKNGNLYLCTRAYQRKTEAVLDNLGALSTPRSALMVKSLARFVKEKKGIKTVTPVRVVPASRVSKIKVKDKIAG